MRQRFRLYRRSQSGRFYIQDNTTGRQESLGTSDRAEAVRLLHARNEADRQPAINAQMARAYLTACDPAISTRTWQTVMEEIIKTKDGSTRHRYERAIKEKAFDSIRTLPLLQTRPEHLMKVLQAGSTSANDYLRRFHHFARAMMWLPWPVLTQKQWPPIRREEKRGITWEEHQKILAHEKNSEHRAFYELLWHVGAAQIDLASLQGENIDWDQRVIAYRRQKTGTPCLLRFGDEVAALLRGLPSKGPLFANWIRLSSSNRAERFQRKCEVARVEGVSLHSYRYAWAERAKTAGYPERFAQEALGHKSRAVHRAYAKKAVVLLPSLEEFEKRQVTAEVIPLPLVARAEAARNHC
jgi:integrase